MAKCKEVTSLFQLSLIEICHMIIFTSENMCNTFGSSPFFKVESELSFVQRYILNLIHPHMLDEVMNNIEDLESFLINVNDVVKSYIIGMCMHPRMKIFKPKFQLPVNDTLYTNYLRKMNHLRSLNLSMVCSDEILEVVGNSCPLLEYIDITSKVGSATDCPTSFNALKLRYFVSDRGLEYLYQCQFLQTIIMNSIIRSNSGGRKISNVGIKNLLLNLKLLKYINYQDMGLVLEEIPARNRKQGLLNLVDLRDNHVTPRHVELFSYLCPQLHSLSLCIPQTNLNLDLSDMCLNRLSNNSITVSTIHLWCFTFNSFMANFLKFKGKHLTTLCLKDCRETDMNSLCAICMHCPNLKILKINQLNQSDVVSLPKQCFFYCLEELHVSGNNWDPSIVFNMCIIKSLGLKVLSLCNISFPYKLDSEIRSLISNNPLKDLMDIALLDGCKMSFPLLKEFLLHCKSLARITIVDDNSESLSEQLIYFISTNSFDITIDIKINRRLFM